MQDQDHIIKSIAFRTNHERSKNKIKKTIPLTIASKRIKYLRINLTKRSGRLTTVRHCWKGISKENVKNWEIIHTYGSEDLTFLGWHFSLNWSTNLTNPHKYQLTLCRNWQADLKLQEW